MTQEQQKLNRALLTCEHGIDGYCWWCSSLQNKPIEKQVDVLKERFDCLLVVVKMLIKNMLMAKPNGSVVAGTITEVMGSNLIKSGADASKPADGGNLAFFYATDTDTIYQRRDSSWIDISFSRPTAPDIRITDVSIDGGTGALQITDTT